MRDLELTLGGHEKFQELCALYPTGSLSEAELAGLCRHLECCETCRTLVAEYRQLDRAVTPVVGPFVTGAEQLHNTQGSWNQEQAKDRLFASIDGAAEGAGDEVAVRPAARKVVRHSRPSWYFPVPAIAAACALIVTASLVGGLGYFAGLRRGVLRTTGGMVQIPTKIGSTSEGPALVSERTALDAQIRERDARADTLNAKIEEQASEVSHLRESLERAAAEDQEAKAQLSVADAQQSVSAADRSALASQLKDAQATLVSLQGQLRQTLDERTSDLMQTATLQRRIDELNAALGDRDTQIEDQRTLLSSDRDIRELMGARDLFIADVFDIARDGTTKQPFGRVFYTKHKSLVFYAFDLDKQRDVRSKTDVAFQAWGQSDTNKRQALNLGVFYIDNETNRRWVLKFDDASVLEKINAVFVTVEPSGGSAKPSGKQLLYAYLEAQPNHP